MANKNPFSPGAVTATDRNGKPISLYDAFNMGAKEERKKIGKWLDNCDGIEIPKDTVVKLPALSGSTEYRAIPSEKLEALKRGEEV